MAVDNAGGWCYSMGIKARMGLAAINEENEMSKTITIAHTGDGGAVRVSADTDNPARAGAEILARRMYGRRGAVGTLRLDSHAADGSGHLYEAFIGCGPTQSERRRGANGLTGRNVWIYV